MARVLRSPVVLMTGYIALVIVGGPWPGFERSSGVNIPPLLIAVLLAYFAATGRRSARVVMITYSLAGMLAVFIGAAELGASKPFGTELLRMACFLAQIALLVSTPMYRRTRPGWTPGQFRGDPLLPWPKLWSVVASAAGGLAMALVPFSDGFRETVCSSPAGKPPSPCEAFGYGYPIAYRYGWSNLTPRGIDLASFATDWVLWGSGILIVVYLVQLNRSREHGDLLPAEPVPEHP